MYFNPVVKQNGITRYGRTTGLSWTLLDVALNQEINQRGKLKFQSSGGGMKKSVSAREAGSELERAVEGRDIVGSRKAQAHGWKILVWWCWVYAPQKEKLTRRKIVKWRVFARQLW